MYKRRFVPVFRDFPEGCGVHKYNPDESSLIQSKFKGIVAHREDLADLSKTENSRIEGESVVESNGAELETENSIIEGELIVESSGSVVKPNRNFDECLTELSSVKKRRLSSTMEEVQGDLVNTSKRVIVMGLAASSKCPWSQPKKKRGSRQEKRKFIL